MQLAQLNDKLAEQKVVLAEKSSACELLLQEISTNTTVGQYEHTHTHTHARACTHLWLLAYQFIPPICSPAEEKKGLAEEKAKEVEDQNKIIAVEKKDAESSLAEALPALEAARTALQGLEKSDVTEIRCFSPLIQCLFLFNPSAS